MNKKSLKARLAKGLNEQKLVLSDEIQDKLIDYLELLAKWSNTHNLTAVTNPETMVSLHLLDSLSILPYVTGDRVIDVGTGAGLPGLVLAIACPQKKITLLDSNRKKTIFLTHVVHKLAVSNVEIVQHRVENFKPQAPFDVIISRAFSSLQQMVEYTLHLAGKQSLFLAMKGQYPSEEMAALPEQIEIVDVLPCQVPLLTAQRHIVLLRKKLDDEVTGG